MKKRIHLNENEIEIIRNMAKDGYSLNEISKKLKKSKTTIYYWFVKFVGKKLKPIHIDRADDFLIGQFIGAFAGDGNFFFGKKYYHYRISFSISLKERVYAFELGEIITKIFGKKPYFFETKDVILVIVYGKDIFEFINNYLKWGGKKTYSVELKQDISKYSNKFLRGFVRGFFDTDGFITINNKTFLGLGSVSKKIMLQVSNILNLLGVKHSFNKRKAKGRRKEFYYVNIYKDRMKKFNREIGFTNPVKKTKIDKCAPVV